MKLVRVYQGNDQFLKQHENLSAVVGGKGAGLIELTKVGGVDVPAFWLIKTENTFNRGIVDISQLPKTAHYAVRSGAPVSMPGAMETVLNVPHSGIQKAVESVWDSWDSPKAVAYREAHNTPNTGTGVVIQVMVDSKYSGVAFTADINNPYSASIFSPKIQYVEGYGDALVSGQVQPKYLEPETDMWLYNKLHSVLNRIHTYFGASDVEWTTDGLSVWIVQRRPLVFNKEPVKIEGCGDIITGGLAIGAQTQVIGRLITQKSDYSEYDLSESILCVHSFTPETYPVMMKVKGIITTVGGEFCHAAIVAREMGKPAVTVTGYATVFKHRDSVIFLDGINGGIFTVKDPQVIAETSATQTTVPPTDLPVSERRILFRFNQLSEKFGIVIRAERTLHRFYYTMDLHKRGKITRKQRDAVVGELAKIMFNYTAIASICEARHAWYRGPLRATCVLGEEIEKEIKPLLKSAEKLGFRQPDNLGIDRVAYANLLKETLTNEESVEILTLVYQLFCAGYWSSSYGGYKWSNIADISLKYARGEVSSALFLDAVYNQKHNGGSMFGKFPWIGIDIDSLGTLLSLKQEQGVTAITNWMLDPEHGYKQMKFCGEVYQDIYCDYPMFLPTKVWNWLEGVEETQVKANAA